MISARDRAQARAGVAFALPAFALIVALLLAPLVALLVLSVTDYRLGAVAVRSVGLEHYAALFSDEVFQRSLRNTFLYVAFVLPGAVFGGLGVALLIHGRTRSRTFYEIAYFLQQQRSLRWQRSGSSCSIPHSARSARCLRGSASVRSTC
jgi:multiple sugar transport system permease protein